MRTINVTETSMRLRSLRMEHGYRVKDIAEMLGISGSAVTQWEIYNVLPSIKRLVQLSDIYGIPIDMLIAKKGA